MHIRLLLGLAVCLLRRNEQDLIKPFTIVILPLQLHGHRTLILAMRWPSPLFRVAFINPPFIVGVADEQSFAVFALLFLHQKLSLFSFFYCLLTLLERRMVSNEHLLHLLVLGMTLFFAL